MAFAKSGLRPFIFGTADTAFQNRHHGQPGGGTTQPSDIGLLTGPVNDHSRARPITNPNPSLERSFQPGIRSSSGDTEDDGVTNPRGYAINLAQPLFEGFRNLNAIRQAKSTVQAAREALRTVEQTVLLDATTAYVNVVRDQAVVRLRENDVSVLTEQLKATKDRFDVGEVTRTDVAQAEARRRGACDPCRRSSQSQDEPCGLRANHRPSARQSRHARFDPALAALDARRGNDAWRWRESHHLDLRARGGVPLRRVEQIMGEMLPDAAQAQYEKRFDLFSTSDSQETTRVVKPPTSPFIRAAASRRACAGKETNNQLKKVEDARPGPCRRDRELGHLAVLGPAISSAEAAVAANKIALTGVREEEKVGSARHSTCSMPRGSF